MTGPLQRENLSYLQDKVLIGDHNILHLYTGAVMRDLAVEQHSTQNRVALSQPYRANTVLTPVIHHSRCTVCLTSPLPSM